MLPSMHSILLSLVPLSYLLLAFSLASASYQTSQLPLSGAESISRAIIDYHPAHPPRINYELLELDHQDNEKELSDFLNGMEIHPVHITSYADEKFNLMIFADGYTRAEFDKFHEDVQWLKDDIISPDGALRRVADLLNIWMAFVPSEQSGIGTHDQPLPGAALGLYRPGSELRAVYVKHPRRARRACKWIREGGAGKAGCDQAVLLGNDPLYGGLGGEFTIITASKVNGPQVLRHELGHSLIPVGEEYDGGWVYTGVNSDKAKNLDHLKWKKYLSDPDNVRIEDAKMAVQAYPWWDLDQGEYNITFSSSSVSQSYPTALLRTSLSSIPSPSHLDFALNGITLNLSRYFADGLEGSLDRRWLDIMLPGLKDSRNVIKVELTDEGRKAEAGLGGKMLTSLEVIEYGGNGRFNHTLGHVGAYPTFDLKGHMTLRPTNEGCLMRNVTHPQFCSICADGLRRSLEEKIARKQERMHL